MNTKLKNLFQQLLQSPRRFPVEAALGLVFFIIGVLDLNKNLFAPLNADILWLFAPLVVFSFWLQRVNRWAYLASFFLFLPLMCLNLKPFLWTFGFGFTYVLAAILLVLGNRRMDNRSFAAHALHVVTQVFSGLLVTGILNLAVMAVVSSFLYIFGIKGDGRLFEYIFMFIWFVLAPQICFTFVRQDEDDVSEPEKVIRLILNYILSPAVIIYTVILYIYFIKIAVLWELPKGGVAWMVMGFITVALAGRMAQSILSHRYYDWFYRHFSLIAVPALIMYWIGFVYRIRMYSFTESRFYLMVAGMLMTLFVLMLFWERTRRYQLMAFLLGAAIILFTYIPGISAKRIGLSCQKQRLCGLTDELKLIDAKTGKLNTRIDIRSITRDSLLCEKYKEVTNVISYVRKETGTVLFNKQYGEWSYSEYDFRYMNPQNPGNEIMYRRINPVNLGEYNILLPEKGYKCDFKNGCVTVRQSDGSVVLEYPIDAVLHQDTMLLHNPEPLFSCRNDSLMLVLDNISISDSVVWFVDSYNFHVYKRGS